MIDLNKWINQTEEITRKDLKVLNLNQLYKDSDTSVLNLENIMPRRENYKTLLEYKTAKLNWYIIYEIIGTLRALDYWNQFRAKEKELEQLKAETDKIIESYRQKLVRLEDYYRYVTDVLFSLRPSAWPVFFSNLQRGHKSLRELERTIKVPHTTAGTRIKELKEKGLLDRDGVAVKPG